MYSKERFKKAMRRGGRMKKPKKLDEHWKRADIICPFCGSKRTWEDTHEEMEANYYCAKCDDGIMISGCCMVRGE